MPQGGSSLCGVLGGRLVDWGSCGFLFCVGVSLWGPLWVGGGSGSWICWSHHPLNRSL